MARAKAKRTPVKKALVEEEKPLPPVQFMAHQREAEAQFNAGKKFQYHAWHRRAGKDWFGLGIAAKEARKNIGTYWHLLPKHIQAKRAIWHGIDHKLGARFLDLFFPDAVAANNTEMFAELECGSTWQLLGSDNYDRMVGSNPRGVIFSEWALCDPQAWNYIRPILRANGGWAIFISTFRGRNHAWQMYNEVKNNPEWYTTIKTVRDTKRDDGKPIISETDIEADRATGMPERMIQQEYYCVPVAPASLGPYARVFDALEEIGAIREQPATAIRHAGNYAVVGGYQDYKAILHCSVRAGRHFIHGGKVSRNVALHELYKPTSGTVLALGEDLRQDADSLSPTAEIIMPAGHVETATFLEHSILSPNSVLTDALAGSLNGQLEEGDDEAYATAAVYNALERLAAVAEDGTQWGRAPNYTVQDRAVV